MKNITVVCCAVLLTAVLIGCEGNAAEQITPNDVVSATFGEPTESPAATASEIPKPETETPTQEPELPGISEDEPSHAPTVEFLSGYLSLFSDMLDTYTYEYSEEEGHIVPVYYDPVTKMPISTVESPYMLNELLIASYYYLYDLNNDDILEVVIFYAQPETDYNYFVIYTLVDGQYQETYRTSSYPVFFTDKQGNVVLRISNDMDGHYGVYYITINDEGMSLNVIVDKNLYNHITQEQLDYERFFENNAIIPGMPDEPIEEIDPLDSLRDKITASVIIKLKAGKKI